MSMKDWLMIGRGERIPSPGDYFTVEIAEEPILVVRDRQGQVRAFSASCRHRGTPIASGEGNCKSFRNPQTGAIELGSMEHETRNTLRNLELVRESAGSSLDKVLKTTVFITDLAEFDTMNRVYREYFPKDPPARSTVQVVALNQGFKIEIECMAGA